MNVFWRSVEDLKEEDITRLVEANVTEGRDIEFKRTADFSLEKHQDTFPKTVCSFANSAGGDLVYGIGATDGKTGSIVPLAGFNPDATKLRLLDLIRAHIRPRVIGVQLKEVPLANGGFAFVVRAPKSWAGPHMLKDHRFWMRDGPGNNPMQVQDVSQASAASSTTGEGIRNFRLERIANILADETPVKLLSGAKLVIHVVPMESFSGALRYDVFEFSKLLNGRLHCLGIHGGETRLDIDGVYNFDFREEDSHHYTYLFRNGIIEIVEAKMLSQDRLYHSSIQSPLLPFLFMESTIIESVRDACHLLRDLEFQLPYAVLLSLLGVRGYCMMSKGNGSPLGDLITRDNLFVPESTIHDWTMTTEGLMRPLFNAVWNACGRPQSPNYTEDGEWDPRVRGW